ncbi:uncharacterized protein LOC135688479 isoform X2 [Rhopilema esculentum]|uniref:uncharacterized protein LOC135688479 isoform X2 n=1 Tax=Rhopilema esculentum TaxID=499914 RepID=UPI0031D1FB38
MRFFDSVILLSIICVGFALGHKSFKDVDERSLKIKKSEDKLKVKSQAIQRHFYEGNKADFQSSKNISVIAFGSCSKHTHRQPLWKNILAQKPDLWIWLGDAVYADTRLMPFVWIVASLPEMQHRYKLQKDHPEYQKFLRSNIPIIGVWDDHDYGSDFGNKYFKYKYRAQDIFLDFLDEPLDSLRRRRQGTFASYKFGEGNRSVKIILLDVRSNAEPSHPCDLLGEHQWQWLEDQLTNDVTQITMIGSGMQIVSDIPFIEKWQRCVSSLDRLVWLTQKRDHVFFLSGDVHFSEVNCMNATSSGYPIYEFTSSGMTHTCSVPKPKKLCQWFIKNVVASCFRVTNVVTEINYGLIKIDWNAKPVQIALEIHGENEKLSSIAIPLSDLERKITPASCPVTVEQPNWYWKRVFWASVIILGVVAGLAALWLSIISCRWFVKEVLKDIDVKIKNGMVKLRKKNKVKHD